MKQEVRDRRSDEVEAMQAYYGSALSSSILPLVSSKEDIEIPLDEIPIHLKERFIPTILTNPSELISESSDSETE